MNSQRSVQAFVVGVILGFLFVSSSVFGGDIIGKNQDSAFIYFNRKSYSDIDEVQVFDHENYTVGLRAVNYWKSQENMPRPFSGLTSTPYLFNLSITSKNDDIQWLDAPEECFRVTLHNNTEQIDELTDLNNIYVKDWGIFLAPRGKQEHYFMWAGKSGNVFLSDGSYELQLHSTIEGREYTLIIPFSVETNLVKERKNLVY